MQADPGEADILLQRLLIGHATDLIQAQKIVCKRAKWGDWADVTRLIASTIPLSQTLSDPLEELDKVSD
jgi:hypothetical protein